ncbi:MAG: type VII toxin-antitoxin system HepT family RNase toxin [Syntrophales bacterium]
MSPDRDVVLAKAAAIGRCLRRIRETTGGDPARLEEIDKQDIFVLNLQRAIQAAIDLAAHIVAAEGLGLPETVRENFVLLQKAGVLSTECGGKLEKMVGFRNIAIHNYQALDGAILRAILCEHLGDLEEFSTMVLKHCRFE